jgi:Animal haem peroxidase
MPQHHLTAPRGAESAPKSVFLEGRFGRLFRNLPSFEPDDSILEALADRMLEPEDPGGAAGTEDEGFDGPIPAGYTYLGQFIDHDITFDPVSSLQRLNDPDALHDFRTPRFDLDSLYGSGPNNDPYLYDPAVDDGHSSLLIGANGNGEPDLPRNVLPPSAAGLPQGRALIGDPRNDENVIVSQLQLLFLRFHNKVVEQVRADNPGLSGEQLFEEAQRLVRWHYQWIVVNDFARRVCGDAVIDDILPRDPQEQLRRDGYVTAAGAVALPRIRLRFYRWQRDPFMPVEFSVAAYRFGHSMIRPDYRLNTQIPNEIPIFSAGELQDEHQDLRGFRPLASGWTIDWTFFFDLGTANLQHARLIDTKLAAPLADVPGTTVPHALARRNLRRGKALGLPSGQRIARAMAITPMDDASLGISDISDQFIDSAPLWFYILKEAEAGGGGQLGPVGGRIVAEVLLGLLKGDPFSYINVEPNWTPTLGATPGQFAMPDLVNFVNGQQPAPPPPPTPGWPPEASA